MRSVLCYYPGPDEEQNSLNRGYLKDFADKYDMVFDAARCSCTAFDTSDPFHLSVVLLLVILIPLLIFFIIRCYKKFSRPNTNRELQYAAHHLLPVSSVLPA